MSTISRRRRPSAPGPAARAGRTTAPASTAAPGRPAPVGPATPTAAAPRCLPSRSGTSSTASDSAASTPGRSSLSCSVDWPNRAASPRVCASATTTAVSVSGGCQSAFSALARRRLGGLTGEQLLGQPLEVALPDPSGGRQLVGVPGDAGRRQLVDEREHQLGEAGDGRRPAARRRRRWPTAPATPPGRRRGRPTAARPSSDPGGPRRGPARRHRRARATASRVGSESCGRTASRRKAPSAICTAFSMFWPIRPLKARGIAGHLDRHRGHGALGHPRQHGLQRRRPPRRTGRGR